MRRRLWRWWFVGVLVLLCDACWLVADFDELAPPASFDADPPDASSDDASPSDSAITSDTDRGCVPTPSTENTSTPVAIVRGQISPEAIAVDPSPCGAGSIFWIAGKCGEDGGLLTADKDGGRSRMMASPGVCDVAASGSRVAWGAYSNVGTAMLDGGNQGFVAADQSAYHIAIYDRTVYWASTYSLEIHRLDADQSPPCSGSSCGLLLQASSGVVDIKADAFGVYWTELGGEPDDAGGGPVISPAVRMALIDGGGMRTLDEGAPIPTALAIGPDRTYWSIGNNLRSSPRSGGESSLFVPNESARGMVVTSDRVYWTQHDYVRSVDLAGRDLRTHATGQSWPSGITADDIAIYWVNRDSGEVMRLSR